MTGLLFPFLLGDAILGWMLWRTWRSDEVWLATRMGRKEDNHAIWWMTMGRLVGLLGLSMVGTVVVLVQ